AIEQRLGGEHLSVLAEAARGHLLGDPRLLDRMQLVVGGETRERRDLAPDGRHRHRARAHGGAVDDHRARAALSESAAEARTVQVEIVAQHVEQRRPRIDVHGVRLAVHPQVHCAHRSPYLVSKLWRPASAEPQVRLKADTTSFCNRLYDRDGPTTNGMRYG